jgi:hypothetical protein
MVLNPQLHIFISPKFHDIVKEAIKFFNQTPIHVLPPPDKFIGTGVYALYYQGNYPLYSKISEGHQRGYLQPIYVGKAVPKGWRTARAEKSEATTLYQRLREHSVSLRRTENLSTADFCCRFVILNGPESNMITIVEAELIRQYKPLWNTVVDGFGNHDPGSGRYNQAKSEWDVLHPGRIWAERLTGTSPVLEKVKAKIDSLLK